MTAAAERLPGQRRALEQTLEWAPMLLAMLFTAVTLAPELRRIPSLNDDAFHFLLIQEASAALSRGGNIFDFWSPVLELGFPQFLYYQHLPHLFVVFVDRLLPGGDLLTTFNAVRYALLVGFPVTVYWSLTRFGFARPGAIVAAAMSPLLAGGFNYGFEYDSYIWRGFGMYTQLWAMHLSLVSLALLVEFLEQGRRPVLTITAIAALILSHLVYAYMTAIGALFLLLWGLRPVNVRTRIFRFAVAWGVAALVTAYVWLPFLSTRIYLSASPYLEQWKYDSFGAAEILRRLATGALFDFGRPPVITGLVAAGLLTAVLVRSRQHWFAAAFFGLWLALYFGRVTWGSLTAVLPLHEGLIMHRFIGGVHTAGLMLVAVGGTGLWQSMSRLGARRTPLFTLLAVAIMLPALHERGAFYRHNETLISRTRSILAADADGRELLERIATLPPGRAFAGLRTDWGKALKVGELAFSDLLTFHRIPAVSPPYQSLSLNADLLWHFDYRSRLHYEVFNVRYVVAPSGQPMPAFLDVVEQRGRYALYRAEPSSYFAIGRADVALFGPPAQLLPAARIWLQGPMPAAREFPEVRLQRADPALPGVPSRSLAQAGQLRAAAQPSAPQGAVLEEAAGPQSHSATLQLDEPATVVLKVTYHPNWKAVVNGVDAPTIMVMPSYVGIRLPPGRHEVSITYRSSPTRSVLLGVSALTILAAIVATRRHRRPRQTAG